MEASVLSRSLASVANFLVNCIGRRDPFSSSITLRRNESQIQRVREYITLELWILPASLVGPA